MGVAIAIFFVVVLVVALVLWLLQRRQEQEEQEPPRLIDIHVPGKTPSQPLVPFTPAGNLGENSPRLQHYIFAHVLMRQLLLQEPRAFPSMMAMARDGVLNDNWVRGWAAAAEMARDEGKFQPIPGGPPRARLLQDGILMVMPPPAGRTECLYVAILQGPNGIRYFTLEMAGPPCETPFMLCEWTPKVHANLGPYTGAATEEAFLANVRARLGRG